MTSLLDYCIDTNIKFFSQKGFETSCHISNSVYCEISDMHIAICVPDFISPSDLWYYLDYEKCPKKATLWFREEEKTIIIDCFLTFHTEDK